MIEKKTFRSFLVMITFIALQDFCETDQESKTVTDMLPDPGFQAGDGTMDWDTGSEDESSSFSLVSDAGDITPTIIDFNDSVDQLSEEENIDVVEEDTMLDEKVCNDRIIEKKRKYEASQVSGSVLQKLKRTKLHHRKNYGGKSKSNEK